MKAGLGAPWGGAWGEGGGDDDWGDEDASTDLCSSGCVLFGCLASIPVSFWRGRGGFLLYWLLYQDAWNFLEPVDFKAGFATFPLILRYSCTNKSPFCCFLVWWVFLFVCFFTSNKLLLSLFGMLKKWMKGDWVCSSLSWQAGSIFILLPTLHAQLLYALSDFRSCEDHWLLLWDACPPLFTMKRVSTRRDIEYSRRIIPLIYSSFSSQSRFFFQWKSDHDTSLLNTGQWLSVATRKMMGPFKCLQGPGGVTLRELNRLLLCLCLCSDHTRVCV